MTLQGSLAAVAAGAQAPPADAARGLTLPEARAEALAGNPELAAAAAGRRAAEGAKIRAGALPNPDLAWEAEDFGGDLPHWSQSQATLSLSQPLEAPGKRKARVEAARFGLQESEQVALQKKLDVLADVDRRFAQLLGAQEKARIAEENLQTAREVTSAVSALVGAGEASPIEADRARSDEALARLDQQASQGEVDRARTELACLLGKGGPDFDRAEGTLAEEVPLPGESEALSAVAELPDLRRQTAQEGRLDRDLTLARRSRWGDLTLNLGWRRFAATGEHAWVAGVGIPLPLFNTGRGDIVEASARLDQVRLERAAEEVRLQAAARSARSSLDQVQTEVRALREEILPGAKRVYEALNEGYRRGKFRVLDLLEARRTFAGVRIRFVEALVRLSVARADLDRLLGTHLKTTGESP